ERRLVVGRARIGFVVLIHALDRRTVRGGGQQLHHAVQQRLHALVLEGGTAVHRNEFVVQRGLTDGRYHFFLAELVAFEVFFHQIFGGFGRRFQQQVARLFHLVGEFGGDVAILELG